MKYLLPIAVALALIAYHGAWGSVECPLLLSIAALVCATIKTKENERKEKKDSQ